MEDNEKAEHYCPECGAYALVRTGLVGDGCLIYACLSCGEAWEIRKSKEWRNEE